MATKKQVEDCIRTINHNSTATVRLLGTLGAQHNDILGELKRNNDNWFSVLNGFFVFLKWLLGITFVSIVGLKLGGLI